MLHKRVIVRNGKKRTSPKHGYLVPARVRRYGKYDTWAAYDAQWNLLGIRSTRAEATSLVLIRTGAWAVR